MDVHPGRKISFLIIFLTPIIFSQMVEPLWSEDSPNYKKCLENPDKEVAAICLISTGNTLSEKGKYNEAERAFKEAIKIAPKSWIKANAYSSLGNALGRQEKYSEAIGFLRKAVKIVPNLGSAWHDLGVVYFKIGKFDSSLQAFKRAISVTNIDWIIDNSYLNLTYIFLMKMDASNTKKDYEILRKRNPILATKFLSELEENRKLFEKFQSFTE